MAEVPLLGMVAHPDSCMLYIQFHEKLEWDRVRRRVSIGVSPKERMLVLQG
jgi:hypothetical protein